MNELPYTLAPPGSPDRYVTTKDVTFTWRNPPKWVMDIFIAGYQAERICTLPGGYIWRTPFLDGIICMIKSGHYFSVSVAPDTEKTMGGSSLHDYLYKNADKMAAFYGVSVRLILHIADHWFLANLRTSDFQFSKTYFIAVRAFGYGFNRMFKFNKTITQ